MKNILVTAGSTSCPIDKVRSISNIFQGYTGTDIAIEFASSAGNNVSLLTSNTTLLNLRLSKYDELLGFLLPTQYKTYDDLFTVMEREITTKQYDVIIHSAAVSDYKVDGTYYVKDDIFQLVDNTSKISSSHDELYLKLIQTPKIIDYIRKDWNYKGVLVKFKLQVGISDTELINIATDSMFHSKADFIVANCLEWSRDRAYIIDARTITPTLVKRENLSQVLMEKIHHECAIRRYR